MRHLIFYPSLVVALVCTFGSANAQLCGGSNNSDEKSSNERKAFVAKIKPVLIDSADKSGTSIGIDYDIDYLCTLGSRKRTSAGQPTVDVKEADVLITEGEIAARLRGTLASSREKNPNKFVDLSAAGYYVMSRTEYWSRLGGGLTYETDQGFENKQFSFGLNAAASKMSILRNGDTGSIFLNLARVNPNKDAARKAAEGNLNSFNRWNFEASYTINTNQDKLRSIDFNYRHYQEISPTAAIKSAGLERNRIGLIRFNLEKEFFAQYSRGSLPFDEKSVRAIKIGWTGNFD